MSSGDGPTSGIYRATPIGIALTRSLNTMIAAKQITGDAAIKIMKIEHLMISKLQQKFDEAMPATMREHVPKRTVDDVSAEGVMVQYINYFDLWKIDAENVTIQTGSKTFKCKRARFVFE